MDHLPISIADRRDIAQEGDRLRRWAGYARTWYRRHRTRRQLSLLESHRLMDVGLSEVNRRAEIEKWFWQT